MQLARSPGFNGMGHCFCAGTARKAGRCPGLYCVAKSLFSNEKAVCENHGRSDRVPVPFR